MLLIWSNTCFLFVYFSVCLGLENLFIPLFRSKVLGLESKYKMDYLLLVTHYLFKQESVRVAS